MSIPDSAVHNGHRARMRAKLLKHTEIIFDTYELLEMLLYSVISYKDTNPVAKRLLDEFGSLEATLSADPEDIARVDGIGERAAELVKAAGELPLLGGTYIHERANAVIGTPDLAWVIFQRHFMIHPESYCAVMMLDDAMRFIDLYDVPTRKFSSAETRPRYFIDAQVRSRGTVAIVGYRHQNGGAVPFLGDYATRDMIAFELSRTGCLMIECLLIDYEGYHSTSKIGKLKLTTLPSLPAEVFYDSAYDVSDGLNRKIVETVRAIAKLPLGDERDRWILRALTKLLSFEIKDDPGACASRLMQRYGRIDTLLSVGMDELSPEIGERAAALLRVTAALCSRRVTEGLVFGERYSEEDVIRYLTGRLYGAPFERIMVLTLGADGEVLACDHIGDGVVNRSDVIPIKIINAAIKRSAASVVLAHNHRGGSPNASDEDIETTKKIYQMLRIAGKDLAMHVIIHGKEHRILIPNREEDTIENYDSIERLQYTRELRRRAAEEEARRKAEEQARAEEQAAREALERAEREKNLATDELPFGLEYPVN